MAGVVRIARNVVQGIYYAYLIYEKHEISKKRDIDLKEAIPVEKCEEPKTEPKHEPSRYAYPPTVELIGKTTTLDVPQEWTAEEIRQQNQHGFSAHGGKIGLVLFVGVLIGSVLSKTL